MKNEPVRGAVLAAVCAGLLLAACLPAPEVILPTSTGRAPTPVGETLTAATDSPTAEPAAGTAAPGTPAGALLHESVTLGAGGGGVALVFDGRALETVRVDVEAAGGTADFSLGVVDLFGNRLATVEDGGLPEFRLPYDGPYRLELVPQAGSVTLAISVVRLAEPSGAWRLTGPGDDASGTLGAGAVHSYAVPLEAGRAVTVEAAQNGEPLPVQVFGPGGQPVGGESTPVIVAPYTGDYAVLVGGGGASGEYTLHVRRADVPPEPAGEPDVEIGRDYRAAFIEGSPLTLMFDAAPGAGLRIEVAGAEGPLTADLRLRSPFGQVLAYASSEPGAEGVSIAEAQLPYAGRYALEVHPHGSGEARIRLVRLEPGELSGGGVLEGARAERAGRVAAPHVFHTYRFEGVMGDSVALSVRPQPGTGELIPALALIGPAGSQVTFSTGADAVDTVETTLDAYRLPQTGTYHIVVYGVTDGTGLYELTYERRD